MAGDRFTVDTNIVIALLEGDEAVLKLFEQSEGIYLPFPVKGELIFGAFKSSRTAENMVRLELLFSRCITLPSTEQVERKYAEIKIELNRKGRPIPENDIWIAACSKAADLPLVTRDPHFNEIEGFSAFEQ